MIDLWFQRAGYLGAGISIGFAIMHPTPVTLGVLCVGAAAFLLSVWEDIGFIRAFKRPLAERDIVKRI